jgi:hypothetical protein
VEIRALRIKGKLAMFYFVSAPIPQGETTGKRMVGVTPAPLGFPQESDKVRKPTEEIVRLVH